MADGLLLLDRDGVILRHVEPYILDHDQVEFVPGSVETMRAVAAAGIRIAVVSNQSPVGRGLVEASFVAEVNERITEATGLDSRRLAYFMCPHLPDDGCECRKPRPGLVTSALEHFGCQGTEAVLVGDHDTDMLAGRAATVSRCIHVLSGRQKHPSRHADLVRPSLAAARSDVLDLGGPHETHDPQSREGVQ